MSKKLQSVHLMTGLQESLFAFEASAEAGMRQSAYVEQFTCKLTGGVDVLALSGAWGDLTDRHAALRTAFVRSREGRLVQAVLSARAPYLCCINEDTSTSIADLAATERETRFDLSRDPLLRVCLMPALDGSCEMVVTFHHIILDAWSAPTLITDLMELYAYRRGHANAPTAPARTTVGALADSQKAQRGAAGKAYWRSILGEGGIVTLPWLDATQPPGLMGSVTKSLPERLIAKMQEFTKNEGITVSAVLHALWGVVLARLNDQNRAIFVSVMANRGHDLPDIERAVGLFAATLPVCVNLSLDNSSEATESSGKGFARLCKDIQTQLRDAPLWSALPLADIMEAAGLRISELDHTMIGRPAALAWGQMESMEFPQAGLTVGNYSAQSWDHFDFQIGFSLGNSPFLEARHDLNRIPIEHVELLLTVKIDLLERLLDAPTVAINAVPVCKSDALVSRLYGNQKPANTEPVISTFAKGDPEAILLGDSLRTLSRATLEQLVDQMATELTKYGMHPGDRVAIAAVQGNDFVVQSLACWKVGACFVPVNPAWPLARQQQIVNAARAKVLLGLPSCYPSEEPASDTPDLLAYCIFTSGTTGAPKGVAVLKDALENYCQSAARTFGFTQKDRALQVTSPAFDLGYTTAFGLLAKGGAVFWLGAEAAVDPDRVLRAMADRGITVIKATPTFLSLLLSAPNLDRFADLTHWRLLILGGESPDPDQIARLAQLCPWLHLASHYGPTETTIGCAMTSPQAITSWSMRDNRRLGTPVAGTEICILDRFGDTLPRGVLGEIAVGGAALAQGYLPPTPKGGFTSIGDRRFYRTGDLGRVMADGALEFGGRCDGIGKIRGHRVDPEEIRLALLRDPAVQEAAVAITGQGVAAQIIAFVRILEGPRDPALLRTNLKQLLTEAQIPQRFVFLSRLLMTENGKIDTATMLAAISDQPDQSTTATPPCTPTEKRLARVWATVLGLEKISGDADFFLLGGHSLRAIEVSSQVERETGLRVPLRWFNETPLLNELAARIDAMQGKDITDAGSVSAVMRLYDQNDAAQMLCFPSFMGSSSIYREWLGKLAPDWSVDGVEDLSGLDAAPDITSMARWILDQTPDSGCGYRVLLGWSFGADLAVAAAGLLAQKEVYPLVVLLDRLPGEPQTVQDSNTLPLDQRRYWSQVMPVLRHALPESRVAEYESQFVQRMTKQQNYQTAAQLKNPLVGVLSDPDGPVAQSRLDRLQALSTGAVRVLTCGADHYNLFHPPHLAQWSSSLRSLVDAHICGKKLSKIVTDCSKLDDQAEIKRTDFLL